MAQPLQIDAKNLIETAQVSDNYESYQLLTKHSNYRIGVGARVDRSDKPSLFLEGLIRLSGDFGSNFDLLTLERSVNCLKLLHARGYSLTYEDANWISCDTNLLMTNPNEEYVVVSSMLKTIFT